MTDGGQLTQILISVRDEVEAKMVSQFDIGILDVKEPGRGALGASDRATLDRISAVVGSEIPLSFSIGELADWVDCVECELVNPVTIRYGQEILSRFQFVKVGLATMRNVQPGSRIEKIVKSGPTESGFLWQDKWQELFRSLPSTTKPVLVAYLDWEHCGAPFPDEVIELAARLDCCEFVLFDTFHKSNNLFGSVSISELKRMVKLCARGNLKSVVAGSVNFDCLGEVISAQPDFIGVRGAVCAHGRRSEIDLKVLSDFIEQFQVKRQEIV